ncbi:hypothetical protein C8Q80DRAFT_1271584 [Daedaleopsis nitida]|nr:hypothetical protein C8Q80DRAFT_1271584 [Daedaleopsis nitida]
MFCIVSESAHNAPDILHYQLEDVTPRLQELVDKVFPKNKVATGTISVTDPQSQQEKTHRFVTVKIDVNLHIAVPQVEHLEYDPLVRDVLKCGDIRPLGLLSNPSSLNSKQRHALRSITNLQRKWSERLAETVVGDGMLVNNLPAKSTQWSGVDYRYRKGFAPAQLTADYKSGAVFHEMKRLEFTFVEYKGFVTFFVDVDGRQYAVRSDKAEWLDMAHDPTNPLKGTVLEVFAEECWGYIQACGDLTQAQLNKNRRGDHWSHVSGVDRQNKETPDLTAWHKKYEDDTERLMAKGTATRRIIFLAESIFRMRFPYLAERVDNCVASLLRMGIPESIAKPRYGLWYNYCINGARPSRPTQGVMTLPHVDGENLALMMCAVFVYGSFNHHEKAWLVFWEAHLIIQLPPGVFIFYPSSLFTHFNINRDDFEIVTTADGSEPTPQTARPLHEDHLARPTCQITRIAQYTLNFVPDGAFWIDSLCVPGVKEMRKRAIHLMADTYRLTEKVIIFDAGIRTSLTAPLREVFLRITTLSWMQRVWTLQEAFLACDIYFELSDRLLPIQHLVDVYGSAAEPVDCALGTTVPRDFALFSCLTETLMLMFDKPEDETDATAGPLGVHVAKLLVEPDADGRMRAFLLDVRTLPTSIIVHARRAGRLSQPGFRWAPCALTALSVVVSGEQFGTAECTAEGLTTERKFSLIVLPDPVTLKRTDTAKDVLGPLTVVNPSSGATYADIGHDSMLGDESVPFNALVTVPGFLELLKHTTSMLPVVAVWLATPHAGMLWSREPVECQYVFNAGLSDMTSFMPTHGIRPLDDDAPTVVRGRFDSVRIKITVAAPC